MKHLWLADEIQIRQELDRMIDENVELICGRRGVKDMKKLPIKGILATGHDDLFVILHPHAPTCSADICTFYYPVKDSSLRFFQCKRVKRADKFIGFSIPKEIYNLYNRNFPRVDTPRSRVTFAVLNKTRIYNSDVANISLEGAKITGELPATLEKDSILTSLSFMLQLKVQSAPETTLHIHEAKVVWTKKDADYTRACGLHFRTSEEATNSLSNYIDFRSIEEQS